MLEGKVLIAQGGGPTAVINHSLAGAVLAARRFGRVQGVYGALHGVRGIIDEDLLDLGRETETNLGLIADTPAAALGSTRDKPDQAYCAEIVKVLQAHDIRYFLYIGGNDSSDTLRIVADEARAVGYQLRCVHVPKTIDNDLMHNDHTPGFPSAARFVVQSCRGLDLDNRALPGIYLAVVMGRHAGFLTAAAALARTLPDDGPHLVYLPERAFRMDGFLSDVKRVHDAHGRCFVAVSEGIHDASGASIAAEAAGPVERDAHGNIRLSGSGALADLLAAQVKDRLGFKRVRADTLGYLQRSFLGCVSDIDRLEAREVGENAVQFALLGDSDGSVAIERTGDYAVAYRLVPLEAVAGKTRVMPDVFIAPDGTDVTDAFRQYLRPLLGRDLPAVHRLRQERVTRLHRPEEAR